VICAQASIVCPLYRIAPGGSPYTVEGSLINVRKVGSAAVIARLPIVEGHFKIRLAPGQYIFHPYMAEEQCWSAEPWRVEVTARERKAREEKEKRAQLHDRLAEAARQNAEQMKWAMEESKKSAKDEADRRKEDGVRITFGDDTTLPSGGSTPAKDNIFRRSKSLKFGSLGKKDKKLVEPDMGSLVASEPVSTSTSAIDDTQENGKEVVKEKEKKNRFSLRKKSFGLLHS